MSHVTLSPLVGREPELTAVAARLEHRRLVTLVGPGGVGKTALARAAAAAAAAELGTEWRFADLARVDSGEAVDGEIARIFGAPSVRALHDLPPPQVMLLVVDNCEHVADSAATAITQVLEVFGQLRVLATSRSPLELAGESIIGVGPLEVVPAVELFCERAADAGHPVRAEHLDAVAELVRALDGLPLAIEIAAARARALTPAQIVDRLGDLDTLSRAKFRGAERHRSVRAAVEWSYQQLAPDERAFFDRLSVIHGGFDADLAAAVAATTTDDTAGGADRVRATTEATLATVVDASLITAIPHPVTPAVMRYRQLATIRAVAGEHLAEHHETARTRERLHRYLCEWALDYFRRAETAGEAELTSELLGLYEHITDALRRTVADDDRPERSMVLLGALYALLWGAHAGEIRDLGKRVVERWPAEDRSVPAALAASTVAQCEFLLGDAQAAREVASRALPAAGTCGLARVRLQRLVADTAWALGDGEAALEGYEAMACTARTSGMTTFVLAADTWAQFVRARTGDPGGLAALRRIRSEAAAQGLATAELRAMNAEAYAIARDDPAAAERIAADIYARASGDPRISGLSSGLELLAATAIVRDDVDAAARHLATAIDGLLGRGAIYELRSALTSTAVLLERLGEPEWQGIAATARELPVVALCATPGHEPLPAPRTEASPLPVREAAQRARDALARIAAAPARPAATGANVFARFGDQWRVEFAGQTAVVRASKGMADLACLLAHPGREVHCLTLAGAAVEEPSLGVAVDAIARREYEDRIRELQLDIDAATSAHDIARAERLQAEFDALVEHLAAALGLGGRARGRAGTTAERARSAVTQRIRAAIRRLDEVHPRLARHLDRSVSTGTFCVYRPERELVWNTGTLDV